MRHLKSIARPSIYCKPIGRFSFHTSRNIKQLTNKALLTKVLFSESEIKSRDFRAPERGLPFAQYISLSINKFPYCKLPKYTQRFSEEKELTVQEYEKIVAFGLLFMVNEENKQKQLGEMGQILMKEQFQQHKNLPLTGTQIFYWHYISKIGSIVSQINSGSVSQDEVTFNMQVLVNMLPTPQVRGEVQKLNEEKIQKMSSHVQSLYVKLLLKHELPSVQVIEHLYKCLVEKTSQVESFNPELEAAKLLISTDNYQEVLPQNIINRALQIITQHIKQMDAMDHIVVIKHIYMSRLAVCKTYIQRLTEQITQLHSLKRGDQIHVPLMLKVIKYRSKTRISNDMFIPIINAYPEKFNTVFREKNMNKEIFMSLTSKEPSATLNMEIKSEFGSYIEKAFGDYGEREELDEGELVRDIKLMLKYSRDIRTQQKKQALAVLINNLYPRARHVASDELKYYVFLVAHSLQYDHPDQLTDLNHEVTRIYHERCTREPTSEDLSRVINIEYQLSRKQCEPKSRPNIFMYDFSKVELAPVVYSYLFYLMKRDRKNGTSEEKSMVLGQVKKNIYKHFAHDKFSIKIIYTLIDVLDELKFADRFIYTDIERAIGRQLERKVSGQSKKNNFKSESLLPKDVSFLMQRLGNQDRCSKKFKNFLNLTVKNYNLIDQYAKEYLEDAQNWENMRTNFKRNREKEANKYEPKGFRSRDNQKNDI